MLARSLVAAFQAREDLVSGSSALKRVRIMRTKPVFVPSGDAYGTAPGMERGLPAHSPSREKAARSWNKASGCIDLLLQGLGRRVSDRQPGVVPPDEAS